MSDKEDSFLIGRLARYAMNYGRDKARRIMSSDEQEQLHNELTSTLQRSTITLKALNATLESMQEAQRKYKKALADGNDEEADQHKEVIASLERLIELQEDPTKNKLFNKIIDRKRVSKSEAHEIIEIAREMGQHFDKLAERQNIDPVAFIKAIRDTVSSIDIDGKFRHEIMEELVGYFKESNFKDSTAIKTIENILKRDDRVDYSEIKPLINSIDSLLDEFTTKQTIHDISVSLADENLDLEDTGTHARLEQLVTLMRDVKSLTVEEQLISDKFAQGLKNNEQELTQMRSVLRRVADQTIETKTLHTLNSISNQFDKAILNTEKLEEALEDKSLGERFKLNPEAISKGKGLLQGAMQATMNALGLGDVDALFGVSEWMSENIGLAAAGAGALIGGGAKMAGKGIKLAKNKITNVVKGSTDVKVKPDLDVKSKPKVDPDVKSFKNTKTKIKAGGKYGKMLGGAVAAAGLFFSGSALADSISERREKRLESIEEGLSEEDLPLAMVDLTNSVDHLNETLVSDKTDSTSDTVKDVAMIGGGLAATAGGIALMAKSSINTPELPKGPIKLQPGSIVGGTSNSSAIFKEATGVADKTSGLAKNVAGTGLPNMNHNKVASEVFENSKNVFKGTTKAIGKALPVLGTVAGVASDVIDYHNAESDAERTAVASNAVGSSAGAMAGAMAGAAVGSVVPVIGTAVGGIVGGIVGSFGGSWLGDKFSSWFSDPEDYIPDSVRGDPAKEIAYIDDMINSGEFDDDIISLSKRRMELEKSLPKDSKGNVITEPAKAPIMEWTNVAKVAAATTIANMNEVKDLEEIVDLASSNNVTKQQQALTDKVTDWLGNSLPQTVMPLIGLDPTLNLVVMDPNQAASFGTTGILIQNSSSIAPGSIPINNNPAVAPANFNTGSSLDKFVRVGGSFGGSINGLNQQQASALTATLAQRESGGNQAAENPWGYLGLYQFGAAALAEVGLIDRAKFQRASASTKGLANGSNKQAHKAFLADKSNWTIPGGKEQFLMDKNLQDQAVATLMNKNKATMERMGVQFNNAEDLAGGLLASHLKGAGSAVKLLKSGVDSADGLGTKTSDYAKLGANAIKASANAPVSLNQLINSPPNNMIANSPGMPLGSGFNPVENAKRLSSPFGDRIHPVTGERKTHKGVDYAAQTGSTVKSPLPGVVTFAGTQRGYGNVVYVKHANGLETRYAHLSSYDVKEGDKITAGQRIGAVGNTGLSSGPHLHYETRINGKPVDPQSIDYAKFNVPDMSPMEESFNDPTVSTASSINTVSASGLATSINPNTPTLNSPSDSLIKQASIRGQASGSSIGQSTNANIIMGSNQRNPQITLDRPKQNIEDPYLILAATQIFN